MHDRHRSPRAGRWNLPLLLLRCYPRAWRGRYGHELAEFIAGEPASPRLVIDLLRGALDAHLHPQYPAQRPTRVRRAVGAALLAAALVAGGYIAQHPATAATFATLGTAPHAPQLVVTATPGEHGYGQRGGRPE